MMLQELAEKFGVSTATISNAINGKGRMSADLRKQIVDMAVESGIDIRSGQRRQRTKNLYIITEHLGLLFNCQIIDGIYVAFDELGIDARLYIINLNILPKLQTIIPKNESIKELVSPILQEISFQASGILYISQYPRNLTNALPKTTIPTVIIHGYTSDGTPCVNYDDAQGAYDATQFLIQHGRRRIAMISGPINSIPMTKRLAGYQRALIDGGIEFDPKLIQLCDWLPDGGYQCARQLLSMHSPLDSIFCQNDSMAIGAIRAVKELGFRVPEDISIIGFDDDVAGRFITPTLTTLAPPFFEIGKLAFEKLWALVNDEHVECRNEKLLCKLLSRESVSKLITTSVRVTPAIPQNEETLKN